MSKVINTVITGTGSYIPDHIISGNEFLNSTFFENGNRIDKDPAEIIHKFSEITEIIERRYVGEELLSNHIGAKAAEKAIENAGIDKETLDYIIFCHNFGDIPLGSNRTDILPSLAAKVKQQLGILNPDCVAYDIIFGCPGWVQGAIQADYFIKSGDAKKVMVIGAETLSRIIDPHDRDSMIFSDGAGAVIFEGKEEETQKKGIIAHKTETHAVNYGNLLTMGKGAHPEETNGNYYLKMNGRKLYEFAVVQVPQVIKKAIDKAGLSVEDVNIVFVHQANGKMDTAIMKRLFKLYGKDTVPENLVPMTISWLGNSSVATVPTLLDLVLKEEVKGYKVKAGDVAVFASVGAGMHINAFVYRF
ncbi:MULTISPECIES: 3-oxoacyl-ACP synthase III family protein [unclassified Pedobacter]|uniref:3-oxoacyl-ACP synthase III family protein n=1 Tax=Pedobacter TaxID=84567 RepID=UPI000B4AEB7D|nr:MULTISPECIES: ketoacyl-ACP synthase III [unclassified Pedobacter]MCX2582637.1 ketoacyl-ACP synthase III [Pedobacter sp. MR22-3]OWK71504.1 3-oxoacyl-ACP synthase [Pedobacter sp. AJM]